MIVWPEHIRGVTTHTRRGSIRNSFRYGVDFVLIDPDSSAGPWLFGRNRPGLISVQDRAHGGALGAGRGAAWARDALKLRGLAPDSYELRLLTQPGFLGHVFNPVSFWLAMQGDNIVAVISEVSTPFKDRHSYLTHLPDFAPITPSDTPRATKRMHVSPFQDVAGDYTFSFSVQPDRIAIRILFRNGPEGVVATLCGTRRRLSNLAILGATLRRPFGTIRTVALIHWQALKLKLKGALWRPRPTPPSEEIS
ncbi:DUF1365 domain-containing protein [Shimia aestuarii]|uniref:Cyclopropane-fatty-acyl-phospholipid synthase n=1 Tax=Shimia aestuarii TaxID=254406 RepID=A0A1I4NB85_9RHOB|nr:DUF1365 domain-containing protein [Shimia aestuarii]SFM12646.1 hypothetical protein SAMN04488042_10486 [Shimia aestuarii]